MLPNLYDYYSKLNNNRDRLEPWFWWAEKKVTPNFPKAAVFMIGYILETKWNKLKYKLSQSKTYDEQFLIFNNKKVSGMIGLDNINNIKKNAELWYFLLQETEGQGTMTASLKLVEDYAFKTKDMESLYAKTAAGNNRSENFLDRNNYKIDKVEYGAPTSPRNPKITDLTTWIKER